MDINKTEILKHGFVESVTQQMLKNVRIHEQSILKFTKYITVLNLAIVITYCNSINY